MVITAEPDAASRASAAEDGDGAGRAKLYTLPASPAWMAWFDRLCRFNREPRSVGADKALALYARHTGFPEPPPPR